VELPPGTSNHGHGHQNEVLYLEHAPSDGLQAGAVMVAR
jgi:hypothetical protein